MKHELGETRVTLPRKSLISISDTPYYHCVSRCVRRAYPFGHDRYTRKSFEHRRQWLEVKLLSLADIFAIKLCAYAVMSNHYHVVLHVRLDIANQWTDHEVVKRWHALFNGTSISQQYLNSDPLSQAQWRVLRSDIKKWRARLCDISWYMRIVNENIARQANKEDRCMGRFWEGRFKSQALLDERALLSCMAYVDLNPIRADMAATPEQSMQTSIKKRIIDTASQQGLESFVGINQQSIGIPYTLKDYIELVDWTGRIIRDDKRGHIQNTLPKILDRLSLDKNSYRSLTTKFEAHFQSWVSSEHIAKAMTKSLNGYPTTSISRSLE